MVYYKFVVDVNSIISALIKDGKSREILLRNQFGFYSPENLINSVRKYKDMIIMKSKLTENEFEEIFNLILRKITIVDKENYKDYVEEANNILGRVDVEDVPYIALALSISNEGIWSDDFHFQKQDKVKIFKTEDIIKLIEDIEN